MNNSTKLSDDKFFEAYPDTQKSLYFIEFSRWQGNAMEYRLFKRNYMCSKSEMEVLMAQCKSENERFWLKGSNECHPYQLLAGTVIEQPGVICFETIEFLKFTVDSLNKNTIDS